MVRTGNNILTACGLCMLNNAFAALCAAFRTFSCLSPIVSNTMVSMGTVYGSPASSNDSANAVTSNIAASRAFGFFLSAAYFVIVFSICSFENVCATDPFTCESANCSAAVLRASVVGSVGREVRRSDADMFSVVCKMWL